MRPLPALVLIAAATRLLAGAQTGRTELAGPEAASGAERPASANEIGRNQTTDLSGRFSVRILALFTGSEHDLGLDHRLGKQVLKLAAAKARRLHPQLAGVELLVHHDEANCSKPSDISLYVAEQYYTGGSTSERTDKPSEQEDWSSASCRRHNESTGPAAACQQQQQQQWIADGDNEDGESRGALDAGRRIDAILGPNCERQIDAVARMAAYWRTPVYAVTPTGGLFGRKDIYSTLTRLAPSIDNASMFVVKIMECFRWRHLAVVVDTSQTENSALLGSLEKIIDRLRHSIPIERKVFLFGSFAAARRHAGGGASGPADAWKCTPEARSIIEAIKRVARVVLLLLNDPKTVRRFLLCAHEAQLNNGEYTFLATSLGVSLALCVRKMEPPQCPLAQSECRLNNKRHWPVKTPQRNQCSSSRTGRRRLATSRARPPPTTPIG
jgi:hypothetical protein